MTGGRHYVQLLNLPVNCTHKMAAHAKRCGQKGGSGDGEVRGKGNKTKQNKTILN